MDIQHNVKTLTRFFNQPEVDNTLKQLQSIGCTIENKEDMKNSPIYISLEVDGTSDIPFIGVFEASAMQDGKVKVWVGIDDDDLIDGVTIPQSAFQLAHTIAHELKVELTAELMDFCYAAMRLNNATQQPH